MASDNIWSEGEIEEAEYLCFIKLMDGLYLGNADCSQVLNSLYTTHIGHGVHQLKQNSQHHQLFG